MEFSCLYSKLSFAYAAGSDKTGYRFVNDNSLGIPQYLSCELPGKDKTPPCVVDTVRSNVVTDTRFAFSANCL